MKKFLGIFLVVYLCMFFGSALYSDDLPEDGMDPSYEPEDVKVPDENLNENIIPVNEPEIDEATTLKDDESRENNDYNTFEERTGEIQSDEKAISGENEY